MESMDGMKEKLGKQIDEADCLTDLQPILNTIPLIKIKTFLKQETTMNADRNICEFYYKSQSMVDLIGTDITKQILSYLSIYELYFYQSVSMTFQVMIGCLLSSDKIYAYCIKSKANQIKALKISNNGWKTRIRTIHVVWLYFIVQTGTVRTCLGCLGFTVSGYHVTITGYDEPDAIMKARDGQTIYESNYNEIHMDDLGYVDCATFDDAIDVGTFTMDMCDGGFSSYKLYSAFIVDADDANSK
eukprot:82344_1